jgi:hypothetical protein
MTAFYYLFFLLCPYIIFFHLPAPLIPVMICKCNKIKEATPAKITKKAWKTHRGWSFDI